MTPVRFEMLIFDLDPVDVTLGGPGREEKGPYYEVGREVLKTLIGGPGHCEVHSTGRDIPTGVGVVRTHG